MNKRVLIIVWSSNFLHMDIYFSFNQKHQKMYLSILSLFQFQEIKTQQLDIILIIPVDDKQYIGTVIDGYYVMANHFSIQCPKLTILDCISKNSFKSFDVRKIFVKMINQTMPMASRDSRFFLIAHPESSSIITIRSVFSLYIYIYDPIPNK